MLKINLMNAFAEPFPGKCQILNSIIDSSTVKDQCAIFEFIVNYIFANNQINTYFNPADINNNNNNNNNSISGSSNVGGGGGGGFGFVGRTTPDFATGTTTRPLNWPLKLINRSQYGLDYDCIYNFLNTSSLLWNCIFKLDTLGPVFSLSTSCLPSRRVYNEFYGNIELDSVYADLLNDYLNFFLPVTERDVNFPTFSTQTSSNVVTNQQPLSHMSHRHHGHRSLFKRVIQKSLSAPQDELSMLAGGETDRAGDMKKIDTFLRIINDLLILPFTDICSPVQTLKYSPYNDLSVKNFNTQIGKLNLTAAGTKNVFSPVQQTASASSSPVKYDDLKQNLSNLEIVFALSMVLKHSHFFSNAFQTMYEADVNRHTIDSSSFLLNARAQQSKYQYESGTDELRGILFKAYWRKTFYKYLQFHFEHMPFTSNIRWFIELWLTYIQPWKFSAAPVESAGTASIFGEFMRENFLIYNDMYQLILKRFCFSDLTNEENVQMLHRIFVIFANQRDQLKKCNYMYANCQALLMELAKQDYGQLFRHNPDAYFVFSLFGELDKPVHQFRSIIGMENLKLIANIYEGLSNTFKSLNERIIVKNKPKTSLLGSLYKNIFQSTEDTNINITELNRVMNLIEACINLLEIFYKSESNYDDFDVIFRPKTTVAAQSNEDAAPPIQDTSIEPDYEVTQSGAKLRLTPKGRYQVLNGLKKPNIINVYDPDRSAISDNENRPLVYFFNFLSNLVNEKFSNEIEQMYNRTDFVGKMSKKLIYGPKDLSSQPKVTHLNTNRKLIYEEVEVKPKISFRKMASYKFIFYFTIYVFLIKIFTGYSFFSVILIVFLLFLAYALYKN